MQNDASLRSTWLRCSQILSSAITRARGDADAMQTRARHRAAPPLPHTAASALTRAQLGVACARRRSCCHTPPLQ